MAFQGLQLRFIRFLGPTKEPAEFTFTPGLNILWGSSDTGKTFLVQAIDFMLGARSGTIESQVARAGCGVSVTPFQGVFLTRYKPEVHRIGGIMSIRGKRYQSAVIHQGLLLLAGNGACGQRLAGSPRPE